MTRVYHYRITNGRGESLPLPPAGADGTSCKVVLPRCQSNPLAYRMRKYAINSIEPLIGMFSLVALVFALALVLP